MLKFLSNKKTIITIFSAIFAIIFALILIKNIFSYSLIENNLSKYLNLKIELINPKTVFDYKFNIVFKSDYINIYNPEKSKKYTQAKDFNITFKPLALLAKKISVKKLYAKDIDIILTRDNNGKIDFLETLNTKNIPFKNQSLNVSKLSSNIENINIVFNDNCIIPSQNNIKIQNFNVDISKRKKYFKLSQTGEIKTTIQNKTQIAPFYLNINSIYPFKNISAQNSKVEGEIKNINLSIFSTVAKKYISDEIKEIKGLAKIKLNTKENFILKGEVKGLEEILKDKKIPLYEILNSYGEFNFEKNNLIIKALEINSKDINIKALGEVKKVFSQSRDYDITINFKNTQMQNLVHFLPDDLIFYNKKGIPTLKKSNFKGILNGEIKAKYKPLEVDGNLKIENIHIPKYPKSKVQNDVNLYFIKDKLKIYTKIYTPSGEYVTVDGYSKLDNSLFGSYSITSSRKVELDFAQLYLVPIQQIIGFNLGPVPIMKIGGFGNIDIKTQGTIKDPHVFGNFKASQAQAKIEGLDANLKDATCELDFDNQILNIKEVKGKYEGADFIIKGKSDISQKTQLEIAILNAKTSELVKTIKNSEFTKKYIFLLKNIAALSGFSDVKLELKGTVKDFEKEDFLSDLALKGDLTLENNKVILNNKLGAEKINGNLSFGEKQKGFFEFYLGNSKIITNFISNTSLSKITQDGNIDIKLTTYSNNLNFKNVVDTYSKSLLLKESSRNFIDNFKDIDFSTKLFLETNGKINLKDINLENIKNKGYIVGLNSQKNKGIKFNKGLIKFSDDKAIFDDVDINLKDGNIKLTGEIKKILSAKPISELNISIENLNLKKTGEILSKNAKITSLYIKKANAHIKNNFLKLNPISVEYNTMPIFLSANIKDITNLKDIDAHFSTILNEKNADSAINPYLTYPIKIKEEIPLNGNFKGNFENYSIDFDAIFPQNSDIYFSGANLGDMGYKREIKGRIETKKQEVNINNLRLIKYISNQNKKTNPIVMITGSGKIVQRGKNLNYENFKILSQSPLNVRILNLIFKKSLLKKGIFECAFLLNGEIKAPNLTGRIFLQDLDIPLYDTQINSIKADITKNLINAQVFAKNNNNDLKIKLSAQNTTQPPYVIKQLNINSNKINIDDILKTNNVEINRNDIDKKFDFQIKPQDVIIENGFFEFKDVNYDKISAQNLKGEYEYKNNLFKIKNLKGNIAQGEIQGSGEYSLLSTKLNLKAHLNDCSANILAQSFLNLSNQIHGKINSSLVLSAKNLNTPEGIKSVNSDVIFSVENGKMPKLGSLEYLLRAGNLFKSGILGLSLNNVIQVLTPYKTGEFEQISGILHITNAQIENLEIFSKGKNLSLYSQGKYDILENLADIKIYGKLSHNVSNALGKIGNANLAQFFEIINKKEKLSKEEELQDNLNKIPSIEIKENPKYFSVRILGDINKDNYVKSFNWE